MKLFLAIEKQAADSEAGGTRRVIEVENLPTSLGGSREDFVQLAELPGEAVRIEHLEREFQLTVEAEGITVNRDNQAIGQGATLVLRNGDELTVGPWRIRVQIVLPRVDQRPRTGWLPKLTVACIALLLIIEMTIGVMLPVLAGKKIDWGREMMRQRVESQVDNLHRGIRSRLTSTTDRRAVLMVDIVETELDRITQYLREHDRELTAKQYSQLYNDVMTLRRITIEATDGKLFAADRQFDADAYVRQMLEEN